MKHTVYLSGPMGGCTHDEMRAWRLYTAEQLNTRNVLCTDPTRSMLPDHTPLETERWINRRDFFDCTNASVILVNLVGMKTLSIGTIMEVAWAYQKQIPVIVVCDEDCYAMKHPMMKDSVTQEARSLEEGIGLVKELLHEPTDYRKIHLTK